MRLQPYKKRSDSDTKDRPQKRTVFGFLFDGAGKRGRGTVNTDDPK